jgi:hypothetical protein
VANTENSSSKLIPMFQFRFRHSRFCRLGMVLRNAVRSDAVGMKLLPSESLRSCTMPPRAVVRWTMAVLFAWMVIARRLAGACRVSKRMYGVNAKRELRTSKDT